MENLLHVFEISATVNTVFSVHVSDSLLWLRLSLWNVSLLGVHFLCLKKKDAIIALMLKSLPNDSSLCMTSCMLRRPLFLPTL